MLNPHRPMNYDKNKQNKRYGSELISELYKQEAAFKSFVSSLNKCPNRYPPSDMNPQQEKNNIKFSSIIQKQVKNLQTPQKIFFDSKIQTIEKIKNSQDIPLTNFRITKVKDNRKSLVFDPFQSKSSRVTKSMNKNLIKSDLKNSSHFQSFQSSSLIKKCEDQNDKMFQRLPQKTSRISQINKKVSKQMGRTAKNLRVQKTSSISWDPNSKQFISSLFSSSKQSISTNQSNFLMRLLNIDIQSTINFLIQQSTTFDKIDEFQVKSICNLFQNILQINQINPLQDPLIKKYSNCIFYGEKPNFVSVHSGIILYFNGNAYFGSLFNFQKHGLGIQISRYQKMKQKSFDKKFSLRNSQDFQNESQLIGFQSFTVYQGNFQKNSKTGLFRVSSPKFVYQGTLLKSLFQGEGTLINSRSTFKGRWEKNKKVNGLQIFNEEEITFEGSYLQDKFHGFGRLRKPDELYEGQFTQGYKNGRGIQVNKQFIYEGSFKYGLKNGKGTFFDKVQYKQKNEDKNEENYDFDSCVYCVQFSDDEIIDKIELKKEFQEQLQTFEEEKSQDSTLTIDFQNTRPSKILTKAKNDKFIERQANSRETFLNFQKYRRVLSVIPSQPEQQILFPHKVNTYILGNQSYRSPRKL